MHLYTRHKLGMYLSSVLVADNLSNNFLGVLSLTKHLIFVHPHMPISESWCLSQALYEQDWGKGCFMLLSQILRISFTKKIPCFSGKKSMDQSRSYLCHAGWALCMHLCTKCTCNRKKLNIPGRVSVNRAHEKLKNTHLWCRIVFPI